mgnify:FL=1
MTDDLLVAQAEWLPNYATEIEKAQARLKAAELNGTRVRLKETLGVARIPVKSVAEMAADQEAAAALAAAADKGKMTRE